MKRTKVNELVNRRKQKTRSHDGERRKIREGHVGGGVVRGDKVDEK